VESKLPKPGDHAGPGVKWFVTGCTRCGRRKNTTTASRHLAIAIICLASVITLTAFPTRAQDGKPSAGKSRPAESPGSVFGAVQDVNGGPVASASITLSSTARVRQQTLMSGVNGKFAFMNVSPGNYFVTVRARGFLPYTSAKFAVVAAHAVEVPRIKLSVAPVKTAIVVRPTEVIAQMQMKAEEQQRVVGIFPNFYTSYVWNAAPLDTRQKFVLSMRDLFDPVSFLGVAATAGIEQANNTFAAYGQGAAGYGKRFSAALGDELTDGFLSEAVFPSVFHQDPRYFYQGSGSIKSRLIHAISWSVIGRSDKGRPMPDYPDMLADLTSAAISNLYYPRANRGAALVFTNFGIGFASRAGQALLQEFVLKRLTKHAPGK
jgi:Carboxypeptidase regulatory-like domain